MSKDMIIKEIFTIESETLYSFECGMHFILKWMLMFTREKKGQIKQKDFGRVDIEEDHIDLVRFIIK